MRETPEYERVSEFPTKKNRYPWDKWLDGSVWKIDMEGLNLNALRVSTYQAGKRRGLFVKTTRIDGCLYLQAFKETNEDKEDEGPTQVPESAPVEEETEQPTEIAVPEMVTVPEDPEDIPPWLQPE